MAKYTQEEQVIQAIRRAGGFISTAEFSLVIIKPAGNIRLKKYGKRHKLHNH